MFDELGAVDVGHKNWRHEWFIDLLHQVDGVFALPPDHNAIRMHQIADGAAFAQELRIADNIKLRAVAIVAFDGLGDFFACFHRHGAFIDNHAIAGQYARDFPGDFLDEAKIDIAVRLLRSGDGDENDL